MFTIKIFLTVLSIHFARNFHQFISDQLPLMRNILVGDIE